MKLPTPVQGVRESSEAGTGRFETFLETVFPKVFPLSLILDGYVGKLWSFVHRILAAPSTREGGLMSEVERTRASAQPRRTICYDQSLLRVSLHGS